MLPIEIYNLQTRVKVIEQRHRLDRIWPSGRPRLLAGLTQRQFFTDANGYPNYRYSWQEMQTRVEDGSLMIKPGGQSGVYNLIELNSRLIPLVTFGRQTVLEIYQLPNATEYWYCNTLDRFVGFKWSGFGIAAALGAIPFASSVGSLDDFGADSQRIYCPYDGWYGIGLNVLFSSVPTGRAVVALMHGGIGQSFVIADADGSDGVSASALIRAVAGDYIQAEITSLTDYATITYGNLYLHKLGDA